MRRWRWTINKEGGGQGKDDQYHCYVGHSYSEKDLVLKQGKIFESTLWVALRIIEERRNLLKKIEEDNTNRGFTLFTKNYKLKVDDIQGRIGKLKEVLFAS